MTLGRADGGPQAAGFIESAVCIVAEVRRDFQADISVTAFGALVYRHKQVGSVLDVANREHFVAAFGIEIGAVGERVKKILI